MEKKKTIHFFLFVLLLYPFTLSGQIRKMSVEERVNRSDLIVVGEVKHKESRWDERRSHIWTYVTVSVEESIKGLKFLGNITLKVPGGIIEEEGVGQEIEFAPEFKEKEKVLLILRLLPDGQHYATVNSIFGKFSINGDKVLGERYSKKEFIQNIKAIMSFERKE